MNTRTGRIIFQDPNPPPAQTYLDRRNVAAHMQTVERNPASSEATYRRATTAILKWLFKEEEGYDVVQEDDRGTSVPDHVVFKVECRAGGSFYTYDFMMVEVKKAGTSLRRSYSKKAPDDAALLELFSRILAGQERSPALEQGMNFVWEDVYDFANPFGDRRGDSFNSVWTFDLEKNTLILNKKDQLFSVSLSLARQRPLALDDFEQLDSPTQTLLKEETLPGPYWEPKLDILPRQRSFLGRILRDFAHTWRHVLRRQMNTTAFVKLAYATL
ncbi:hypothetical protein B0J15DRAFT_540024 [Fusarium solani]|uniref:Uncharacterized protein n=1 Tax=Fusarium solani TaxID=169388 RepID=A0A9P9L676_FUSSL|nr:uncharacterized protein B0J15DRAFT_540024 [Fusarium solani]KAH7274964.1 hypothetical protein B0J15DRAFT_540024 [Fusarium solani]